MRTLRNTILVCAFALAAACATAPPRQPARVPEQAIPPGLAAEYAAYRAAGTASISGQAFLRTLGGDVRLAAGCLVTAEPATTVAVEYMKRIDLRPNWPEAVAARRAVTADAEGRFTFEGLPAGRWLVVTEIYWQVPRSTVAGVQLQPTGGMVAAIVEVGEGERRGGVVVTR
jgi:hypothetical protein